MTIAVLETGGPPGDLAERFGDYGDMFSTMLGEPALRSYDAANDPLPDPQAHDGYIVSGSPAGVYDREPWVAQLLDWLAKARGQTRLVGICFGHQAMAQAFGGRVEKSDKGWGIGLHEYAVIARQEWMDTALAVSIPASHQDQVVAQPPDTDITLASAFTPLAGLSWQKHAAISFQCHPEFTPAYAKALIEARRDRLPDAERAIASLNAFNDNDRVAGWIRRFLGLAQADPSS